MKKIKMEQFGKESRTYFLENKPLLDHQTQNIELLPSPVFQLMVFSIYKKTLSSGMRAKSL